MKSKNIIIGIGALIVLIIVIVAGWIMSKPIDIILQGQVEAKHIRVASKIPGRIDQILVTEGQRVQLDDTLVIIGTPELDAKLVQAQSARNAAESQSIKAQEGARKEQIQGAYSLWQKSLAGVEVYEKTYIRVKKLYDEGVVPAQKLDEANAQYKAALQTEKAAKSQYDMAINGAREEDKVGAAALVDQASGVIQEIDSYLSEAQVKAPITGEIASIISQEGELINSGYPIITIVDLSDVWLIFNIREDFLSKIKMGDELMVQVPALGNKTIKVKVYFINPLGDFATWNATKTTGSFDMKTFEIKAKPTENIKDLRPGMTALINWSKR
ncbi:MAG: hemolysin secretion protein D [Bacteroidetes bacterium 4572_77]|nr:MAG: hemolysin secretion protein D [Bacteroidetes bacterium 4572_77]